VDEMTTNNNVVELEDEFDEDVEFNVACPICGEESPQAMGCWCFNDIHYGKD
jgi:hypothetical protein